MIITDKAQIKIAELRESNNLRLSGSDELECYELIESDLKLPADATFTRSSVAYLSDSSQVAANVPRFEPGKFGKAVMVEEGTTNKVTNGDMSQGTTGWNPNQQVTLTIVERSTLFGTLNFLRVVSNQTGSTPGVLSPEISVSSDTTYTFHLLGQRSNQSAYLYVTAWNGSSWYSLLWSSKALPTGEYNYVTGTFTTGATDTKVKVGVLFSAPIVGDWFEITRIQLEQKPYHTSFIDGTRSPETLTIPTAGVLNPQEGTVECWVYVNSASKYPNRYSTIFIADAGGAGKGIWLFHENSANYWKYQIKDENNSVIIQVPDSEITDGWHYFAITWNVLEAKLFVDGVLKGTKTNLPLPSTIIRIDAGHWNGTNQFNSLIDDLRISNRARTDAEILAAYQSGKLLERDEWTTYKLDFDDKVRITTQGQIICNELIEI